MQHVLILIGISGSGKTTFAKQFVQENPTYLRLNRDDLRRSLLSVTLGKYWKWDARSKERIERLVTVMLDSAVREALEGGWNLIIDNTHLRQRSINELLSTVEAQATPKRPVYVSFEVIDVPLETAIERDQLRTDVVGETAIREQHSRFRQFIRQFNPAQYNRYPRTQPTGDPLKQDDTLPKCILVDIDGTAANIHDRSPYDWSNVGRDLPNVPVLNVVRAMRAAGYAIIFLSGRDSAARTPTIAWIQQHLDWKEHTDYELFMRPRNDNRKDSIIKRELFDTHIRDHYFVELVLDDRDQVVSLWRRDLGLTCLQVNYGNF